MKIFVWVLLFLAFGSQSVYSQTHNWLWAVGAGTGTYQMEHTTEGGTHVVVDQQNNVYVVGYFNDSINFRFPNFTLYGNERNTKFFAKYTSSGQLLWAKNLAGN